MNKSIIEFNIKLYVIYGVLLSFYQRLRIVANGHQTRQVAGKRAYLLLLLLTVTLLFSQYFFVKTIHHAMPTNKRKHIKMYQVQSKNRVKHVGLFLAIFFFYLPNISQCILRTYIFIFFFFTFFTLIGITNAYVDHPSGAYKVVHRRTLNTLLQ